MRSAENLRGAHTSKRPYRSKQQRRAIVEETLQPGASVAIVARRHGVNANQVFHWRKLYRQGQLDAAPAATQLVPVRIAEVVNDPRPPARLSDGIIVVELGRARVRVEGVVDPDILRLILERVGR